jgi:hypothetical protein
LLLNLRSRESGAGVCSWFRENGNIPSFQYEIRGRQTRIVFDLESKREAKTQSRTKSNVG